MSKYLYGASVQGIQKFIFATNKLKEIVGASEIVECISTEMFKGFYEGGEANIILSAAGNIRIIADSKNDIEKLVLEFPKAVAEHAPGIVISQAVVECDNSKTRDCISKLEKLLKIQRNKPVRPTEITALGIERSRRTGKSAVKPEDKEFKDLATKKNKESEKKPLIEKLGDNLKEENFTKNMDDLVDKDNSNWLAVIHADGNGIGKIIQNLNDYNSIKEFSNKLNTITIKAAKKAFTEVIEPKKSGKKIYPIRPIIIGGDDLTVICRADLALDFIKTYLSSFEEFASEKFDDKKGLTASAGIAFVKSSYPFYYAVELAEELCSRSKNVVGREKASVSFHKIQSSFTDSYADIIDRELTVKSDKGNISFVNGPYTLEEIPKLIKKVIKVNEENAPKSGIRKWLSELYRDQEAAKQLMNRVIEITELHYKNKKYISDLGLTSDIEGKTHLYDVLTIASLYQGGGQK